MNDTKIEQDPNLHPRLHHPMRESIFGRQYAVGEKEEFLGGMERTTEALYPEPHEVRERQDLIGVLRNGEGQFGGRVLAGAGTPHGNLLNCFVQDFPEGLEGTTGVMGLAKNLALVTKVGGGNGVNLDSLPPKQEFPYWSQVGEVYLTISDAHPDAANVMRGRFMDLVRGEYVEKPYGPELSEAKPYGILEAVSQNESDDIQARQKELTGGEPVRLMVEDSVTGIWDAAAEMVRLMLDGKTVIVDLTLLRPEGEAVRGSGGASSGPASFAVEIFDNFARWARLGGAGYAGPVATLRYIYAPTLRSIRQGGVRRGAGMATMRISNPDIRDFITSKDLDREGAEGDIGTFNISVLVDDEFMKDAGEGAEYKDSWDETKLLKEVAEHAHATGEPGLIYVDTINKHNMGRETQGDIVATNPCGEIGLYPGEPCDLAAINLAAFVREDGSYDRERLKQVTRIMVRALDRILDVENAPLPEIREAIDKNRRIGLGVMGLADMLVRLGLRYDSPEGRGFVRRVVGIMTETAIAESERLGEELGVPEGVREAGFERRNIAVMTVAPTGTISMMTGVSGGVEPIFSGVTYRRIGTEHVQITHPLLEEILLDHAPEDAWDWDTIKRDLSDAHGSLRKFYDTIPDDSTLRDDRRLEAFVTAHEIEPNDHILMQAAVQKAFDFGDDIEDDLQTFAGNSISKTINLPNEASVEDVLEAYELAWTEGCKGVTVYRDGSRQFQVLSTSSQEEEGTEESADPAINGLREGPVTIPLNDDLAHYDVIGDFVTQLEHFEFADREEIIEHLHLYALDHGQEDPAPAEEEYEGYNTLVRRDNPAPALSFKYQVAGEKTYVQVVANNDGQLVEVFTPAPKGTTPNERTSHEIIGRLMSLALKYGVPAEDLEGVLQGHMDESGGISPQVGYVRSRWDLVADAIGQARAQFRAQAKADRFAVHYGAPLEETVIFNPPVESYDAKTRTTIRTPARQDGCPDCGSPLVREQGCLSCHTCGFSKCG